MFRRYKKSDFVEEISKKKFLSNRELTKEVKHLRLIIGILLCNVGCLENLPNNEVQKFFEEHHSEIFLNFFDYFDTELRSKRNFHLWMSNSSSSNSVVWRMFFAAIYFRGRFCYCFTFLETLNLLTRSFPFAVAS